MATSSYLQFNDPIRIIWRAGTVEDPYVDISESWKIINNKIVLSEIPSEFDHVQISGYTEIYEGTPSSTQFIVNYRNRIVTFNPTEEGKTVTTIYKGRGLILYPTSAIYDNSMSNDEIIVTLKDIIDNRIDIGWKGEYDPNTTYKLYDLVSYIDGTVYICLRETTGNLPTDTIYWDIFAQGAGDMKKSTYDTDGDGIVDKADDSNMFGGQLPSAYEPAITKNTAFNKDFGNTEGTVAEGNHSHIWDESQTITHGNNSFTLSNVVTDGDILKITDKKYGVEWFEGVHWNRNGQVVVLTESSLIEDLTFRIINFGK